MSEKEKQFTVAGLLTAFLLWVLWHYLHNTGQNQAATEQLPSFVTDATPSPLSTPSIVVTNPTPSSNNCCSNACSVNPNTIGTLNQILNSSNAIANAIFQAGNATLQAIADAGNSAGLPVTYTVG